jgi:hypothetical protein
VVGRKGKITNRDGKQIARGKEEEWKKWKRKETCVKESEGLQRTVLTRGGR